MAQQSVNSAVLKGTVGPSRERIGLSEKAKIIKKKAFQDLNLDGEFLTLEQQMSIKSCKYNLKIYEIDGKEPKRIGGEAKMKPLDTGYALSKQIIKEFIKW